MGLRKLTHKFFWKEWLCIYFKVRKSKTYSQVLSCLIYSYWKGENSITNTDYSYIAQFRAYMFDVLRLMNLKKPYKKESDGE